MRSCIVLFLAGTSAGVPFGCIAAEPAHVTGIITDDGGQPLDHATVMVSEAYVRKGYSVFCPSCWPDCGKHTFTDADGNFNIGGLNPQLVFNLVVVKDGYATLVIKKVDPEKEPAKAGLKTRTSPPDPAQYVRGRVVNRQGDPVQDAIVEQQGVGFPNGSMHFGGGEWIDALAVTNEKGEFEMAYAKPATRFILDISPRAMASKLFTVPTGADRKTLMVTEGATIRGRLVRDGKPVANVEIGLATHSRRSGTTFNEMRIGTDQDGRFSLTNVPPGRVYYVYGKMESLGPLGGATGVIECETKDDGEMVNVGDIQVTPAYRVRGKVVLNDGKPLPPDTQISLFADRAWDSQNVVLDGDGHFEFKGLASGVYDIGPSVRKYKVGDDSYAQEVMVHHDIDNLVITLRPDSK